MAIAAYNDHDSLEDLRRILTRRLTFVLIGFGVFGAWYLLLRRDIALSASGLLCLMIILARSVQAVLLKKPEFSRYLLMAGLLGLLFAGMLLFPNPWLPWLGIPCVFIGATLINHGGLFTAVGITGAAFALNLGIGRQYPLIELGSALTLAAISSWLSAYTLFTAVHWYGAMQARSEQLLDATRNHRAELSQALKSLEMAYETQKHTQLELIWARNQAEDGRRLKEQFAANISHELRTPLNLILGFSDIMYRSPEVYGDVEWSPRLRRDIHQIYRSSQHLLDLIDDILDLSRFEMATFSLVLEVIDLRALLQETIEIARDLTRGRPVALQFEVAGELPLVEVDRTRIRQVVLNILSNACAFTEAGSVTLSARVVNREVMVSITDTGAGIPKDKLPYLFDEFYQVDPSLRRSHAGAGLGLAITRHFVEAHGGRIWVESSEGKGTRFTFALPLTQHVHPEYPTGGRPYPSPAEDYQPCVLVIEPDPTIISMMRRYIRDCDLIQVKDTETIAELAAKVHPRAIIRNIRRDHGAPLPENFACAIPVIECSLPSPAWVAEDLAIAGYLTKPISAQRLLDEIERSGQVQNILVIDDDRGFVLLIERILQSGKRPIKVRRAYDAAQGLEAIRESVPDLVMLDMVMPGVDGLSLLSQIQSDPVLCRIPVILLGAESTIGKPSAQNPVIVYHRDGLYPIEVFGCLNAVIKNLKPRYQTARIVQV